MSNLQLLNRQNTDKPVVFPERIVQFGAGNFLRAFANWAIQELNENANFDSSVVVVKVTPKSKYEELDAQEGLFHVHLEGVENGKHIAQTNLIDCISRAVYPYDDYNSYLELARQPEIRFLISNTTEAGISYNENDNLSDTPPSSFPAKLTIFLHERYQHFGGAKDKGCIIIPTELIVDNGTQLREIILRYAEQWQLDADFSSWISEHNIFCNTLVDRIVSGYPDATKSQELQDKIGYEDKLLVMGEPYHSWIIEAPQSIKSEFPIEKTRLNIKIVDDATPYRQTKVRILNGLHSSMVPIGILCGLESVRDCIEQPAIGQFLQDEVYREIIPAMDLPQNDLTSFAEATLDRFRNPSIHHRLMSIAMNSSSKTRTRILPTIIAYYDKFGTVPEHATLAMASFIRLYKGAWQNQTIPLNDDPAVVTWFQEQWQICKTIELLVESVLKNEALWQQDLSQIEGLHRLLSQYLEQIDRVGILPIINELNG